MLLNDNAAATVANNIVRANRTGGIFAGSNGAVVVSNTVRGTGGEGIAVGGTGGVVVANDVRGNEGIGILIDGSGHRILDNVAINNDRREGVFAVDCEDDSTGAGTAGTANTWIDNVGAASRPPGICLPPGALTQQAPTSPPAPEPTAGASAIPTPRIERPRGASN